MVQGSEFACHFYNYLRIVINHVFSMSVRKKEVLQQCMALAEGKDSTTLASLECLDGHAYMYVCVWDVYVTNL